MRYIWLPFRHALAEQFLWRVGHKSDRKYLCTQTDCEIWKKRHKLRQEFFSFCVIWNRIREMNAEAHTKNDSFVAYDDYDIRANNLSVLLDFITYSSYSAKKYYTRTIRVYMLIFMISLTMEYAYWLCSALSKFVYCCFVYLLILIPLYS